MCSSNFIWFNGNRDRFFGWSSRNSSSGSFIVAIPQILAVPYLQASYAFGGAISGPLFCLFCLGIFCPSVNAKVINLLQIKNFFLRSLHRVFFQGAVTGFIAGVASCLWIVIGILMYPRPSIQLPVNTDNCPSAVYSQRIYEPSLDDDLVEPDKFSPT